MWGGSSPVKGWGSEWMRTTKMQKKRKKKVLVGSFLRGGGGENWSYCENARKKSRRVRSWPGCMWTKLGYMLTKNWSYCENAKKSEGVRGWGGQGGCEQRIEVIVKMKKKVRGSGGGKVSVDVKLKLLWKWKKKSGEVLRLLSGIGGGGSGRMWRTPVRGRGGGGVRADVKEEMK